MRRGRGSAFGVRLLLAILLTLGVVGMLGYVLMAGRLRDTQIAGYVRAQRADVRSFEAIGRRGHSTRYTIATIDQLLDAVGQRPGTLETLLVDPHGIVVASGNAAHVIGRRDVDARIADALRHGRSYSGGEADPKLDPRDFEFVSPVSLPGGRYVLEVGYDHRFLDAQLNDVRHTLALIGLLALLAGTAVFYVVGGRTLMRSHRSALQRATRDGLTDLPNQRAFQDEFPRAMAAAARYQQPLALIVFDIDDFKFINDRHGHLHGDTVLGRVAAVLRNGRAADRGYRLGGDEFALVLPNADADGARAIGVRLVRAFSAAEVAVSIGIGDLRPGQSAHDLRAEADAALYEAKRRGGHRAVHFDEIRDQIVISTSARTDLVRRLIDDADFSIAYQPIWDLGSGRLLGVEALMRPSPGNGLTGPEEAFDLAERIGRIHDLDVLCATRALHDRPDLPSDALLFVNLTPHTLDLDATGEEWLAETVEHAGLSTDQVVIEITERAGARTDAVIARLKRLRAQGFQLALDDVGTGNSGLEMLRKVSADFVKIDRSIVLDASTNRSARAVLMAMATYARQTGSYVIAEGIEDEETLDFLAGIDRRDTGLERIIQGGQGYGLGRPAADGAIEPTPAILGPVPPLLPA